MSFTNDTKPMGSFANDSKPSSVSYLIANWSDATATWGASLYSWGDAVATTYTNDIKPS